MTDAKIDEKVAAVLSQSGGDNINAILHDVKAATGFTVTQIVLSLIRIQKE